MIMIAGLGNFGDQYKNNRHNIGFILLDLLAKKIDPNSNWQKKDNYQYCKQKDILLLKPISFMNNSGSPILKASQFYKIKTEAILLIYDDLDLDFGKIRFREAGSSAGHNGLKSVFANLGTEKIARVKIGIGRPANKLLVRDYVLSDFNSQDLNIISDDIFQATQQRISEWLDLKKDLQTNKKD